MPQDGRRRTDGGDGLPRRREGQDRLPHGGTVLQMLRPRPAAGQDQQVRPGDVRLLRQGVRPDGHAVAGDDLPPSARGGQDDFRPRPAEQVRAEQCLALLRPVRQIKDRLAHV